MDKARKEAHGEGLGGEKKEIGKGEDNKTGDWEWEKQKWNGMRGRG